MTRRGSKTLFSQFNYAINQSFQPGTSKNNEKYGINYNKQEKIYSYADREQLRDTANAFSQYCKEKGIKLIKDIKESDIKGFLSIKAETCTQRTIDQYASRINKLMTLSGNNYHFNPIRISSNNVPKTQKGAIRTFAMSEYDYQKAFFSNRDSKAKMGVELAHEFGLRSNEIVCLQVGDIKGDRIHICHGSKGGRERTIIAETYQQKELIIKLSNYAKKKDLSDNDRIVNISKSSLHKYERIHLRENFGEKYKHSNNHAIRKNYAERTYLRYRSEGNSHKEAWGKTSLNLGHSFDRETLFKVYCPNLKE